MNFLKKILEWIKGLFSKSEDTPQLPTTPVETKPDTPIETPKPEPTPLPTDKPLLRKGAKGKYVMDLQVRLEELGYDVGTPDGDFGDNTEKALRAFEKDHKLPVDGLTDLETWQALAEALPPIKPEPKPDHGEYDSKWFDLAIQITGSFEGKGYNQITGNFDGMGVSAGILQWNYGTGSLQAKILKPYLQKNGSINALGIFPKGADMDASASMTTTQGVAFAKKYMLSGTAVKSEWKTAWEKFLTLPGVRELQRLAAERVRKSALDLCESWDLVSPRAFCFFFDIVTQNGSMKGVTKPKANPVSVKEYIGYNDKNKAIWAKVKFDEEQQILFQAAWLRAKLSRSEYIQDVFSRKGTIAAGTGIVHGKLRDFNFDLGLNFDFTLH